MQPTTASGRDLGPMNLAAPARGQAIVPSSPAYQMRGSLASSAGAGPSSATACPIDPALVALPREPDLEFTAAKPAKKVSGVRQGKQRGRPAGSGNYATEDVNMLLNFVQEELPLGSKGWKITTSRFNKWAKKANRPMRNQKSLETKFKQVGSNSTSNFLALYLYE